MSDRLKNKISTEIIESPVVVPEKIDTSVKKPKAQSVKVTQDLQMSSEMDWIREQNADLVLQWIKWLLDENSEKPQELKKESPAVQLYCKQWDSLQLQNGILCRVQGKHVQRVVPARYSKGYIRKSACIWGLIISGHGCQWISKNGLKAVLIVRRQS